jgi:hypothetical protein
MFPFLTGVSVDLLFLLYGDPYFTSLCLKAYEYSKPFYQNFYKDLVLKPGDLAIDSSGTIHMSRTMIEGNNR